jgi:conjugal transfer mating pair stabilization protein TraG
VEYIAYGGGEYYRDVFNAVAMLAGTDGLSSLIRLTLVLGVLFSLVTMIFKLELKSAAQWFFMAYLAYGTMWVPKVQIQVTDVLNPYMTGGAVANVPLGVGFVASLSSRVGDRAIQLTETAFGDPDSLRYSETGMIYGAKLVERMRSVKLSDPRFEGNVSQFITSCVYQDILTDHLPVQTVAQSTDLWATVSASPNPGILMNYHNLPGVSPAKEAVDCTVAAQRIQNEWPAQISNTIREQQKRVDPTAPESELLANGREGAEAMHQLVFGASRDATDIFRQALMVNMMRRGVANYAGESGASALDVMAETQAEVQTRNLQHLMGGVGERAVPILKIVVEVMLIGIFPILFPAFLLPKMGPMMIKGYLSGFLGLQAWGPLYVILNKIMMGQAVNESAAASYTPGMSSGIRLSNLEAIGSVNSDIAALAGTMLMSIPVLVSMLMRGVFAVGGMGESLMSTMRSGAESAAASATTGNFSFGNTAFDNHSFMNTSGNKFDTNTSIRGGQLDVQTASGGMQTVYADGSRGYQAASSSIAGGIDATKALSTAAIERGSVSRELGANLNSAASEGWSKTMSDTQRYVESWQNGTTSRFAQGSEQRTQAQNVATELDRASIDHSQRTGMSMSESRALVGKAAFETFGELSTGGTLGTPGKGFLGSGVDVTGRAGARVSGGVEASGTTATAETTAEDIVRSRFSDKSWSDSFSRSSASYAQQSFEKSSSASQMSANEKADTFQDMQSLTNSASRYKSEAERYEKVSENAETLSQNFKQNYDNQFVDWAYRYGEQNGMSRSDIEAAFNPKGVNATASRERLEELQQAFADEQVQKLAVMPQVESGRAMSESMDFSSAPQVVPPGPMTRESLSEGVGDRIPDLGPGGRSSVGGSRGSGGDRDGRDEGYSTGSAAGDRAAAAYAPNDAHLGGGPLSGMTREDVRRDTRAAGERMESWEQPRRLGLLGLGQEALENTVDNGRALMERVETGQAHPAPMEVQAEAAGARFRR